MDLQEMQILGPHVLQEEVWGGTNNLCFNKPCRDSDAREKKLENDCQKTNVNLLYGDGSVSNLFSPRLTVHRPSLSEGIAPGYSMRNIT